MFAVVIAGLVPAIALGGAQRSPIDRLAFEIETAGTSPAVTPQV
jgi:hypothetical protein